MKKYNIIIVGATGIIGREIIKILAERKFPTNEIIALASAESMGMQISYGTNRILNVENLASYNFNRKHEKEELAADNNKGNSNKSDENAIRGIIFFATGSNISSQYAEQAAKAGLIVIDNSSYFRLKENIPLIIPEVNIEELEAYKNHNHNNIIIANPNCSTIQLVLALKPLYDFVKIKRVTIATYQSVSGVGKAAMDELYQHTKNKFTFGSEEPVNFQKPIPFNCIPQIGEFDENNFSQEENKIINETRKILKDPEIEIEATCVRVPVFIGHAEAVTIEFFQEISINDILEILAEEEETKGSIILVQGDNYKTQLEIPGYDGVFICRVRQNGPKTISMWIVADNLRKGGALNAVQIAEHLIKIK